MKEYVLANLCSIISKEEIDRLLQLAKNEFRSKYRVNKIMFGKIDEVVKEVEKILTKNLLDNQYEVNQVKGQGYTNPEVQTMDDTFVLQVETVEKVEVNIEDVDAGKEDEGKDE